mgnify:FL=1
MCGGNTFGLAVEEQAETGTGDHRAPPHPDPELADQDEHTQRGEPYDRASLPRKILNFSDSYALCISPFSYSIFRRKVKRGRGIEAAGTLYFHVDTLGDLL